MITWYVIKRDNTLEIIEIYPQFITFTYSLN